MSDLKINTHNVISVVSGTITNDSTNFANLPKLGFINSEIYKYVYLNAEDINTAIGHDTSIVLTQESLTRYIKGGMPFILNKGQYTDIPLEALVFDSLATQRPYTLLTQNFADSVSQLNRGSYIKSVKLENIGGINYYVVDGLKETARFVKNENVRMRIKAKNYTIGDYGVKQDGTPITLSDVENTVYGLQVKILEAQGQRVYRSEFGTITDTSATGGDKIPAIGSVVQFEWYDSIDGGTWVIDFPETAGEPASLQRGEGYAKVLRKCEHSYASSKIKPVDGLVIEMWRKN